MPGSACSLVLRTPPFPLAYKSWTTFMTQNLLSFSPTGKQKSPCSCCQSYIWFLSSAILGCSRWKFNLISESSVFPTQASKFGVWTCLCALSLRCESQPNPEILLPKVNILMQAFCWATGALRLPCFELSAVPLEPKISPQNSIPMPTLPHYLLLSEPCDIGVGGWTYMAKIKTSFNFSF